MNPRCAESGGCLDTGVYQVLNLKDGKSYVGSAISMTRRFRQHRSALAKGRRANRRLLNAWRKYGAEFFQFRVLLYCNKDDLLFYEQLVIDGLKPEYNIRLDAGSNLGIVLSAETRRRISEVQKGVPKGPPSLEHRKRISAALVGKIASEETRRRISEVQKGRVLSIETRRRQSMLSDEAVRSIRKRLDAGESQAAIARAFGMSPAAMCNLNSGRTYPWVGRT